MKQKTGSGYARDFFKKSNSENYDQLVQYATLGYDSKWKKKMLDYVDPNSLVLELACGTGILSKLLSHAGNPVLGLDLTFSYLKILKQKVIDMSVVNSTAELIPFQSSLFDYVIGSYLPKYTNLDTLINECFRVLKKGGMVVLHDFTYPTNPLYKVIWEVYFRSISLVWGRDKRWKSVFEGLDILIRNSKWDLDVLEELKKLKFTHINRRYMIFQTSAIVTAIKS